MKRTLSVRYADTYRDIGVPWWVPPRAAAWFVAAIPSLIEGKQPDSVTLQDRHGDAICEFVKTKIS